MSAIAICTELDAHVLEEATAIYAAAGLTLSEALRLLLVRTAANREIPFDTFNPNEETIEAMLASRRGETVHVGSIEDLMADLHADD